MCQLYALLANEPTKVECALVRSQNALMKAGRGSTETHRHVDGWGVVCYDQFDRSRMPTTVKHSNAGFGEDHFDLAAEQIYSKAIVAHVRLATVGFSSTLNAHPFTYDEWTFAHHGTIPGFEAICHRLELDTAERYLNCRLGTTDSELVFLWLLSRLQAAGVQVETVEEQHSLARKVLVDAIAELADDCAQTAPGRDLGLTFVLTNGHVLFACRWNQSLYRVVREGMYTCGVCGTSHIQHEAGIEHRAIAVATKPLSTEDWQEIPNHALLYVDRNLACTVDIIPVGARSVSS